MPDEEPHRLSAGDRQRGAVGPHAGRQYPASSRPGLGEIGIPLREVRVIPDVPETIINTVNEVRAKFDYVFTTGGIGPTHDDITSECVAAAFGVPWEPHPVAWARMERSYKPGRIQCGAPAHGDDAARRDADRQRDVRGARLPDRQRLRHGRRAARHAVDVRVAGAAAAGRHADRVALGARVGPARRHHRRGTRRRCRRNIRTSISAAIRSIGPAATAWRSSPRAPNAAAAEAAIAEVSAIIKVRQGANPRRA